MDSWRLLVHGAASPARNMAVDEAILREVREPVLRLYAWDSPAVSLGYFQAAALAGERPFIRRYTGGGLVDHAHDITYTVVLPRAHPWMELSAPASYEKVHRGVRAVLSSCGIASELTPTASALESTSCFQKPVKFDLVAPGSQKLSGAAQRRTREGLLHQGSILLADPSVNEAVRAAFPTAFARELDLVLTPSALTPGESDRAFRLERERYATAAWNRSR